MKRPLIPHVMALALLAILAALLTAGSAVARTDKPDKPATTAKSDAGEGWLGISMQELNDSMAKALDIEDGGVLVNSVSKDSPADKAGLEEGDVIVSFAGKEIDDTAELSRLVRRQKPGSEVQIGIIRDGASKDLEITVGERKSDVMVWSDDSGKRFQILRPGDEDSKEFFWHSPGREHGYLGVSLRDLTAQLGDYFGVKDGEGALIEQVSEDTPAAAAGLKAGDVIVQIDDEKIDDVSDATSYLRDKDPGDEVAVTVMRKGKDKTFKVTLDKTSDALAWAGEGDWEKLMPDMERLQRALPRMERGMPHVYRWYGEEAEGGMDELRSEMRALKKELEQLKKQLQQEKEGR
jgi:serine protease Do